MYLRIIIDDTHTSQGRLIPVRRVEGGNKEAALPSREEEKTARSSLEKKKLNDIFSMKMLCSVPLK